MTWDAIIAADDPRWEETLRRFSAYDFHHLPGYVALEAERRSAHAFAFVYQTAQGSLMIPFIESPTPLPLSPVSRGWNDAVAPYGYAGPLVCAEGDLAQQEAFVSHGLARLLDQLKMRNICAIMARFHPLLLPPLRPFQALGKLVVHGETVCVDLRQTPEQLWSDTRRDFRNPINRMQRLGFTFEVDGEARHLAEFVKIYHETMLRVRADPQYFFSKEYFTSLKTVLGSQFILAHVRNPAGKIVASGVFTVCSGIMQFHLSGSSVGSEGSDASKFLLHGVRAWGRERGAEKFHLGGGVGAKNDSLFLFKSGFSSGRAQFHTWRLIVDAEVYQDLCLRWESCNRQPADSVDGYFPAYRKLMSLETIEKDRRCA